MQVVPSWLFVVISLRADSLACYYAACRHCKLLCRHNAYQLSAPDNDGYGVTYATLVSNLNIYKPHYFDNSTL